MNSKRLRMVNQLRDGKPGHKTCVLVPRRFQAVLCLASGFSPQCSSPVYLAHSRALLFSSYFFSHLDCELLKSNSVNLQGWAQAWDFA
jgi:hypothetical protein